MPVLLVGLTGGIASGKSLVREVFEQLGARTVDADAVSREVVAPGTPALAVIVEEFGRRYLLPDGSLDRRRLGDTVFADEALRRRLEAILHPLIGDEIARRIQRFAAEDPGAIVVVDIPLLVEIGMQGDFDKVVVVYADEETRVRRLMERDSLSRHDAWRRLGAQMPLESKLDLADYVINNNDTVEDTRRQVMKVFNLLKNRTG